MSQIEFLFEIIWMKQNDLKLAVLEWVLRFGYTSKDVIALLFDRKNGQLVDSLVRAGQLVKSETLSGSPKYIYTLSRDGLRTVQGHQSVELKYREIDPAKISQQLVRHTLCIQRLTARAMQTGIITGFASERMLLALGTGVDFKRPDAVWQDDAGILYAIEVELTAKSGGILAQSLCAIIDNLAQSHRAFHPRFYLYLSPSEAIINSYQKALRTIAIKHKLANTLAEFGVLGEEAQLEWLQNRLSFIKV